MKTSSCKAKGRALQNWIRDTIVALFPEFREGDVTTAIMGESGADVKLSPHAKDLLPYSIEAKNVEKLNVWSAYDQAKSHNSDLEPLLIMKKNRREPVAVVSAKHFFELIRKLHDR